MIVRNYLIHLPIFSSFRKEGIWAVVFFLEMSSANCRSSFHSQCELLMHVRGKHFCLFLFK